MLKIGTLGDPSVYCGAQMAIFMAEPFHLIANDAPLFEGLSPRHSLPPPLARWL